MYGIAQTGKLHATIRSYITQRLAPVPRAISPVAPTAPSPPLEPVDGEDADGDFEMEDQSLPEVSGQLPVPPYAAAPNGDTAEHQTAERMGVPQSDGAGGLVLPPLIQTADGLELEDVDAVARRKAFPHAETSGHPTQHAEEPAMRRPSSRAARPSDLLPEIGRLAREIVRNGEEKLAVAVGAYNSVCPR